MIVVKGTLNGKGYWATVKDMAEARDLMTNLSKTYRKVIVWLEDLCGKIVMTYERLMDRIRTQVPKKRSFWVVIGVVLGVVY